MIPSSDSYRFYRDMAPDLKNFPDSPVFGQSVPDVPQWTCPEVLFKPVSDGVELQPTHAQLAKSTAFIIKKGRYFLGSFKGVSNHNGVALVLVGAPTLKVIGLKGGARPQNDVIYTVYLDITKEAYELIKREEDDHLGDYEYAFNLSLQRVANAINKLAGKYKSKEEAIQALVKSLQGDAPQLIPSDPNDLQSWKLRLKRVAALLVEQSTKRDTDKDHQPDGYIATFSSQDAYVAPRSKNLHRRAEDIIQLAEIPVVFRDRAVIGQYGTGTEAKLKEKLLGVDFYGSASAAREKQNSPTPLSDMIKAGTKVTIVEVINPNSPQAEVLVSSKRGDGVNNDVFLYFQSDTVYLRVRAEDLQV